MFLKTALSATTAAGLASDRVVLLSNEEGGSAIQGYLTTETLIREGLGHEATFSERRLAPGEAKRKVAFLNMSSGTTGPPKVWL